MHDAAAHPQKRRKMHESDGHSINPDMLEILWIQVVVACHFALRLVEIPQFRTFLLYLNKDIDLSKGVYNGNRSFGSLVEIAISPGIIVQDGTPGIPCSTWL